MHLMPEIEFARLKYDWGNILRDGAVETAIDPMIQVAVKLINEDPGLVTIYSCQGHPEQVNSRWSNGGYLMLGVRDVDAVYRLYRQMVVRIDAPSRVDLKLSDRYNRILHQGHFPVWILGWDVTVDTVEVMANALNEAAASYIYRDGMRIA